MKFWSAFDLNLCSGLGRGGVSCPSFLWYRSVACQTPQLTKTACRRDLGRLQCHQDQPWSLSYNSCTRYVLSSSTATLIVSMRLVRPLHLRVYKCIGKLFWHCLSNIRASSWIRQICKPMNGMTMFWEGLACMMFVAALSFALNRAQFDWLVKHLF